jgi:hypothetical protein
VGAVPDPPERPDRPAPAAAGPVRGRPGADDVRGYTRNEPWAVRLDRNYNELLQELRVAQTGVQILFAFLLTLPFQSRFGDLTAVQRGIYLTTLLSAAVAVLFFIAPVAAHRLMFRKHVKDELVRFTGRVAVLGLFFLALALLGALLLVVDVVVGRGAAVTVFLVGAALVGVLWAVLPARVRRRVAEPDDPPELTVPDFR